MRKASCASNRFIWFGTSQVFGSLSLTFRATDSVPKALVLYQERRLPPIDFAYSYMTRTGRVDHAEIRRRVLSLARAYEAGHPEMAWALADVFS